MPRTRKSHLPSLKAKVAVEAIKGHKTTAQIAQMFGVHPTQVGGWKKQALEACRTSSATGVSRSASWPTPRRTNSTSRSASSKWSWTFSKKDLALSVDERRRWIDPQHPHLTVQRQCQLLAVPRSTYYYQPRPESAENLRLLRRLDELYLDCPFFGSRRMAATLEVGRKRIQRLMWILGIEAHYLIAGNR